MQGEQRYDLVVRYQAPYRNTKEAIEKIRMLAPSGERVSLAQLCKVKVRDGASEIYREGNSRYVAIKYSVVGRDLGSTVEEAMRQGERAGEAAGGLHASDWAGEYESAKRSSKAAHDRGADHPAGDLHDPLHHVQDRSSGWC